MSKKNSLAKRRKHHEYQIRMEKESEELAKQRAVKRHEKEAEQRKVIQKKQRVEPVLSAEAKKAKKEKKKLAKQLKSLNIANDKKAGIHNRKMSDVDSSDSESEGEEGIDVDQVGGADVAKVSKSIKKKHKPTMTRAHYIEMKKAQKRLQKSGGV